MKYFMKASRHFQVAEIEFAYPEVRIRIKGSSLWREFLLDAEQREKLYNDLKRWAE